MYNLIYSFKSFITIKPIISTILLISGCCYSVNVENVVTMIRHYSTFLKVPPFSFPLSSFVKSMLKGVLVGYI